jgi:hypothetical protein
MNYLEVNVPFYSVTLHLRLGVYFTFLALSTSSTCLFILSGEWKKRLQHRCVQSQTNGSRRYLVANSNKARLRA